MVFFFRSSFYYGGFDFGVVVIFSDFRFFMVLIFQILVFSFFLFIYVLQFLDFRKYT